MIIGVWRNNGPVAAARERRSFYQGSLWKCSLEVSAVGTDQSLQSWPQAARGVMLRLAGAVGWSWVVAIMVAFPLLAGCSKSSDNSPVLMLGAAASLRTVVPDLVRSFTTAFPDTEIAVTYAGSGTLRGQVEAGAPIDMLILAGPVHVDRLIERGMALRATRKVVATNAIVLVTPRGRHRLRFKDLARLDDGQLLAIGMPSTVPAGNYARQALMNLGLWNSLATPPANHLVFGNDVAAVLAYAGRGEVDAAIVYATDAEAVSTVVVSDSARGSWAPQPEVVAVATTSAEDDGSAGRGAVKFVQWLSSTSAQAIFRRRGFSEGIASHNPQ